MNSFREPSNSKSVYSLILSDDVISEIDRIAYANSTNRSNMVNQILAEYACLTTPEKKMQEIFDRMESLLLSETRKTPFQLLMQQSDSMFSLRSAISYKYNPTVKYSVELYKNPDKYSIGELRVSLRTQNQALIEYMNDFYGIWYEVEDNYFDNVEVTVNNGKYIRKLKLNFVSKDSNESTEMTGVAVGKAISDYINIFDKSLKTFFANLDNFTRAASLINNMYKEYLNEEVYI